VDAAAVLQEQTHHAEIAAFAGGEERGFSGIVVLFGKNPAEEKLMQRFLITARHGRIDLIRAQGDALVQQRSLGTCAFVSATDKQQRNGSDD
jgi:hypothetical protein